MTIALQELVKYTELAGHRTFPKNPKTLKVFRKVPTVINLTEIEDKPNYLLEGRAVIDSSRLLTETIITSPLQQTGRQTDKKRQQLIAVIRCASRPSLGPLLFFVFLNELILPSSRLLLWLDGELVFEWEFKTNFDYRIVLVMICSVTVRQL